MTMALLTLLAAAAAVAAVPTSNVTCPKGAECPSGKQCPSVPVRQNRGSCDYQYAATATYRECEAACCASPRCASWNW